MRNPRRRLALAAGAAALVLLVLYVMGVAVWPGGTDAGGAAQAGECPASEHVSIEGPEDRPQEDAGNYAPGRDWSLLDDYPELLPGSWLGGGFGAERYLKARLPWRVRFRMEWDSEGSLLAAYGSHDDICSLARVVERKRRDG
jgi:hypothetical protein